MNRESFYMFYSGLVLLLIVLLMISALGFWFNGLRVGHLVNTGDVSVRVSRVVVEELPESDGKDVAHCSYVLTRENDVETLVITVSNGYPGFKCNVTFTIENDGSIPVIGPFLNISEIPREIHIAYSLPGASQIHPGEHSDGFIYLEVLQSARENNIYVLKIYMTYVQWNEVLGSISGYVWEDSNSNGYWDPGEQPVGNVLVNLFSNGYHVSSVLTDQRGYYEFRVSAGSYVIAPNPPPGYIFTTPSTIRVELMKGEVSRNNNFGIRRLTEGTGELDVKGEFRRTDVDLQMCPPNLGSPLDQVDGSWVVRATVPRSGVYKDRVRSIEPGAFYHVLWIRGSRIREIEISYNYDYQFDIHDGTTGKIRAYLIDLSNNCTVRGITTQELAYSIDNSKNIAYVKITLADHLLDGDGLLIYTKFRPTKYSMDEPYGLVGHNWETLDKYFDVNVNVSHDSASVNVHNIVEITTKRA